MGAHPSPTSITLERSDTLMPIPGAPNFLLQELNNILGTSGFAGHMVFFIAFQLGHYLGKVTIGECKQVSMAVFQ